MITQDRTQPTGAASRVTLRRFRGPEATELFLLIRPDPAEGKEASLQAAAAYAALGNTLALEGAGPAHVVQETVYFRSIREDMNAFLRARDSIARTEGYQPAATFIEQPPLTEEVRLEISAHASIPLRKQPAEIRTVSKPAACDCSECPQGHGRVISAGDDVALHAGNVHGPSGSAYEEALGMFSAAEALLLAAEMDFRDVMRTWIYLRDMERDYAEFNRARRDFFRRAGVRLRPASTGIQGTPYPSAHNFCLGFYALRSPERNRAEAMTTPTLNEAWTYGSDFSRGMKVAEANKLALHVSGTASVDEEGRTAHPGDFDAQVKRMMLNISTLLAGQDASQADMVSAVTYLKRAEDAPRLQEILAKLGLEDLPNALVLAPVCRPDLLCEMEAVAALPRRSMLG